MSENKTLKDTVRFLISKSSANNFKLPFLHLYQYKEQKFAISQTENSYIYFVLDGKLRLHTPSGIMDYIENQYSVSSIDAPDYGYVLSFSEQQDFLACAVSFTSSEVVAILIKLDDELKFIMLSIFEYLNKSFFHIIHLIFYGIEKIDNL